MVVRRGLNEHSVLPMAREFRERGHILRLIEYMDVGHTNGWRLDDVVPAAELVAMIDAELPLEPAEANYRGEVARRYRYRDGSGEVGVIASVTQPFCGDCTRARLSADGSLYTCLFATKGHDLRALLRDGASDAELEAAIGAVWLRPRRPLFGAPLGADRGAAEGRDVLHRRLEMVDAMPGCVWGWPRPSRAFGSTAGQAGGPGQGRAGRSCAVSGPPARRGRVWH